MRYREIMEAPSTLRIRLNPDTSRGDMIIASVDGKDVAWYPVVKKFPGRVSLHANVDPSARRQGITTRVYDWAEDHFGMMGLKLEPFFRLSNAAYEFWKARDPASVADYKCVKGHFEMAWYSPYGLTQCSDEIREMLKERVEGRIYSRPNPPLSVVERMLEESRFKELRGIVDSDGTPYYWDAYEATHEQAIDDLNLTCVIPFCRIWIKRMPLCDLVQCDTQVPVTSFRRLVRRDSNLKFNVDGRDALEPQEVEDLIFDLDHGTNLAEGVLLEKTMVISTDSDPELRILLSPTRAMFRDYIQNTDYGIVRGIGTNTKSYIWDANDAFHYEVAESLALDLRKDGYPFVASSSLEVLHRQNDWEGSWAYYESDGLFFIFPDSGDLTTVGKLFPNPQKVEAPVLPPEEDDGDDDDDDDLYEALDRDDELQAIMDAAAKMNVKLEVEDMDADGIALTYIKRLNGAPKGSGARVMRMLMDYADGERLVIHLEAENPDLMPYYEQFGFRWDSKYQDRQFMFRYPE